MIATLFILLQSAAVPAGAPAATSTPAAAEKKICRSRAETGSFVRKNKTCLTRAEWQRVEEENREAVREVQNRVNSTRPQ